MQTGINTSIRLLSLVAFILLFSCETPLYVNCEECYTNQPVDCTVEILIRSDYGGQQMVDVVIYFGKMEDGVVIDSLQASYSTTFRALINNEYTIVVTTSIDGKEYKAVNSVKPEYQLIEGMCEEDCYIISDNVVNMKLKYY
ncbi:MAG: hypothetical protein ABR519_01205 [Bacteroidales bacterium]